MTTLSTLTLSGTTYSFLVNGKEFIVRVETKSFTEEHVRTCMCSAMGLWRKLTNKQ